MKYNIITLLCFLLLVSCSGRGVQKKTSNGTTLKNATETSAKADIEQVQRYDALVLMSRMMDSQAESPTADEDWEWMRAMGDSIAVYSARLGRTMDRRACEDAAMQDIEDMMENYTGGDQIELNVYAGVMSTLAYYRTLNMYDRLISAVDDAALKDGIRKEYSAWQRLYSSMSRFITDYTYAGVSYSSLPMDINEKLARWARERYEFLVREKAVLVDNDGDYSMEITLKILDEDTMLEREIDAMSEILSSDIHLCLMLWIDELANIAGLLPDQQAETYKALSWRLVNKFYIEAKDLMTVVL